MRKYLSNQINVVLEVIEKSEMKNELLNLNEYYNKVLVNIDDVMVDKHLINMIMDSIEYNVSKIYDIRENRVPKAHINYLYTVNTNILK